MRCVGLSPSLEGEEMPVKLDGFSGGDRTDIVLPAVQEDLLKALAATGKPLSLCCRTAAPGGELGAGACRSRSSRRGIPAKKAVPRSPRPWPAITIQPAAFR